MFGIDFIEDGACELGGASNKRWILEKMFNFHTLESGSQLA